MSYQSPYQNFIFEDYSFDPKTAIASFHYSFDDQRHFTERLVFQRDVILNLIQDPISKEAKEAFKKALQLSFYLAGISYYKAFPTKNVVFKSASPNAEQAEFLQNVYTNGLSQFLFENDLPPDNIATFEGGKSKDETVEYQGEGTLVLQSGGKDSLLLAALLAEKAAVYTPWYVGSVDVHPAVLNQLSQPLQTVRREIDKKALEQAAEDGGLNGHVPVTYIVLSYAVTQAILLGKNTILSAIGAEGEEPHEFIGDLPVNHQWSKTWEAEQLFSQYVNEFVSPNIVVGSPLRGFSELRIAELFVEKCWQKYGHQFSSCNRANYQQGADNATLAWCGECPKCANSYLLFAPFVEPKELQSIFGGQDLFAKQSLQQTFKGLLGIDGVMKPFECVGETEELRLAYHMAKKRYDYNLPFEVPEGTFDYKKIQQHNNHLEPNLYNL